MRKTVLSMIMVAFATMNCQAQYSTNYYDQYGRSTGSSTTTSNYGGGSTTRYNDASFSPEVWTPSSVTSKPSLHRLTAQNPARESCFRGRFWSRGTRHTPAGRNCSIRASRSPTTAHTTLSATQAPPERQTEKSSGASGRPRQGAWILTQKASCRTGRHSSRSQKETEAALGLPLAKNTAHST